MLDANAGTMPTPQAISELSQFFRLLSEPTRLQLLCLIKYKGPMDAASLVEVTGFGQSHISRQMGQLQRAGLLSCKRYGIRMSYEVADPLVDELCNLVHGRMKLRLAEQLQKLESSPSAFE